MTPPRARRARRSRRALHLHLGGEFIDIDDVKTPVEFERWILQWGYWYWVGLTGDGPFHCGLLHQTWGRAQALAITFGLRRPPKPPTGREVSEKNGVQFLLSVLDWITDGGKRASASKEEIAIGVLITHPEWSEAKIAERAGVSRTSLHRFPQFMRFRANLPKQPGGAAESVKNPKTGRTLRSPRSGEIEARASGD